MSNRKLFHQIRRNREIKRSRIRQKYNIVSVNFLCRQKMLTTSSFLTKRHCSCYSFFKERVSRKSLSKKRKEKIKCKTCKKQLETLMMRMVKLAKSYHTCFHVLCQTPKNLQEIGHFLALMLVILLVP